MSPFSIIPSDQLSVRPFYDGSLWPHYDVAPCQVSDSPRLKRQDIMEDVVDKLLLTRLAFARDSTLSVG